jgi:Flp pilus assembly protein TadG
MGWVRKFLGDGRGAAAAEMALMLPLLVTLLFATFEGGYFLWSEHKVVKGVRDGARYAGRLPFSNYSACGVAPATTAVTGQTLIDIQEVTRTGKPSGGTPMIPTWDQNSQVTVTCEYVASTSGLYTTNSGNAPRVIVTASVPYPSSPITELVGALGFTTGNITLHASSQSPVMGI